MVPAFAPLEFNKILDNPNLADIMLSTRKHYYFIFYYYGKVSLKSTVPFDRDDITSFDSTTYCMFQSYTRLCGKKPSSQSYYYDQTRKECVSTDYGNCQYAYNNFRSLAECKKECKESLITHQKNDLTKNIFCRLQPDFGNCNGYYPSFYFDINTNTCKGFSYSGCGGNSNRFPNSPLCIATCNTVVTHEPVD